MAESIPLSPWQEEAFISPREYNLAMLGGKGGGKTFLMPVLIIKDLLAYGAKYRGLLVRWDHAGGTDVFDLCRSQFAYAFGARGFRANSTTGVFDFRGGGRFEINQCADLGDANKFAGRSITNLFIDEIQQWPEPTVTDRLQGNLRTDADLPLRVVVAGNPGGLGHAWLLRRFFKAAPWEPFEDEAGRTWIRAPSTFQQNAFIPHEKVDRQLAAAYAGDAGMLAAMRDGDWFKCLAGAYFASVISESRSATVPWTEAPKQYGALWPEIFLSHDFGSTAPSVTFLVAKSPGTTGPDGRFYPRDSLVLFDELATNEPGSLSKGMGYVVPLLAERIREMCKRWKVKPTGCADDAIFARTGSSAGSIADEFRRAGVNFVPANKADRVTGWNVVRRMLADAGKPDVPGLYISRNCEYFWQTVPYLARDPKRIEDVDSRGPDHAGDAARYAATYVRQRTTQTFGGTPRGMRGSK